MSFGEGEDVPFVASAQMREIDPSKTSWSSLTGTAVPKPYYSQCESRLHARLGMTHIIWFVQEQLSNGQKDTIGDR